MRTLLISFLLINGLGTSAQNWALINPAYEYNYSLGGTDTISNQIFVTHIDTLGVDSFRYELNRIGKDCDACGAGLTSACGFGTDETAIRIDAPQFLGRRVLKNGAQWVLGDDLGTSVSADATLNDTWICPNGSVATIYRVDTAVSFGTPDSAKWIGYSNGDTLLLSKQYGLINASFATQTSMGFRLVGVSGTEEHGAQLPTYATLFGYNVGDVLQYHLEGNSTDGMEIYFPSGTEKYEIMDRQVLGDTIRYAVHVVHSIHTSCMWVNQGWDPCPTTWSHWVENVTFDILPDTWLIGNPFDLYWEMHIWPRSVGRVFYPSDWDPLKALLRVRLNEDHRNVIEQWGYVSDGSFSSQPLYCTSAEDSTALLATSNVVFGATYTEGIGLTREELYYFEGGQMRMLEGYSLDGAQTGTITPDGILLGIDDRARLSDATLFPNPVSDRLTIRCRLSSPFSWCIHSLSGAPTLAGKSGSSEEQTIDVSMLPPGPYFVELSAPAGIIRTRFIIAR